MLRLITLAILSHVTLSAIWFKGVPNCKTMTTKTPANDGSTTFLATFAEMKDYSFFQYGFIPREHPGFDNGYYIFMVNSVGQTNECYFIVDKASQILTTAFFGLMEANEPDDDPFYRVTSTKYALSGPNCETVSFVGIDITDSLDIHTPAGGKGVKNCAFLIHMKTSELTGSEDSMAVGSFLVYYGYKAKYYDGTNPYASSFASMLNNSIMVAFLIISYLLWNLLITFSNTF